jgi:hypothetical protein
MGRVTPARGRRSSSEENIRVLEEWSMAVLELTLELPVPSAADIEASQGGSRWSVAESGWKKLLPDLPDEAIALLATPVVVSAAPWAAPAAPVAATPRARRLRKRI